jgi:hypothetical protein
MRDVQELVERDSGWGWDGFWRMVEYGVRVSGSSIMSCFVSIPGFD